MDLETINLNRDNLLIDSENVATLVNIVKNDKCNLNINNLFGVKKLIISSFHNVEEITIENIENKPVIILENLLSLLSIFLINSDITLILREGLSYIESFSQDNSLSSEILDKNNYLNTIKIYDLYIENNEEFILDEKFLNVTRLFIYDSKLKLPLKKYSKLEFFHFANIDGEFNDINFESLEEFFLEFEDEIKCNFNNCNIDLVELIHLELDNIKKIKFGSEFKNLKKIYLFDKCNSLKQLNLKISENNPDIKDFNFDTTVELSGDIIKHLPKKFKNDYNLIPTMKKSARSVY